MLPDIPLDGEHSDQRFHESKIVCRRSGCRDAIPDNGSMRMFVAAVPPAEIVSDLAEFLAPRQDVADSGWRWSDPAQWHLTLAFLASVPERALDDLTDRLARAATRRAPIPLRVQGGGAFPHVGNARVLYGGLAILEESAAVELRRLAEGCRAAANRAGAPADGARFRPHLTLARRNRPVEATRWVRILDGYSSPPWPVTEVRLVESHLGEGPRGRPRHEVVATFPLGTTT